MITKLFFFLAFLLAFAGISKSQEPLPDVLWSTDFSVRIAKFSPDGQYVYFVKNSDLTNLYRADAMTGETSGTFSYHTVSIRDFDFSPSGDTIVTADGHNNIVLWDIKTRDTIMVITTLTNSLGQEAQPKTVKFTPDGKYLILCIRIDPEIVILDFHNGRIIKEFHGYTTSGLLDVSPDGKFFAFHYYANNWRSYVDLIDLNTYENLGSLETFLDDMYINFLSIPNNQTITAAGRISKYLYIWDKETRKILKTPKFDVPEFGAFIRFDIIDELNIAFISNDNEEDYSKNRLFVYDIDKEKILHEYPYNSDVNLELSKNGYIISSDVYQLRILNPTWKKYIGIKEIKEEKIKHTFYNGKLKIFFDEELFEIPEITIFDIEGKKLKTIDNSNFPAGSKVLETDISYLIPGIYLLEINYSKKHYSIKIIVP